MRMLSRLLVVAAALWFSAAATASNRPADPRPYSRTHTVTERITVSGEVQHPLMLDVAALRGFPLQRVDSLPITRGNGSVAGTLEKLVGVRLRDLLDKAAVRAPGHNDIKQMVVIATASDGYRVVFSWSELFNTAVGEGVLVFFELDGKPLPDDNGRIGLVSSRDLRTGPRHVKWLQGIEVRKITE